MNMKTTILVAGLMLSVVISPGLYAAGADSALDKYRAEGGSNFSATAGEQLWNREVISTKDNKVRSCDSCHSDNLKQAGKHPKTGKEIKPMAPLVNPARYTKVKKIEKWFKRNCKWTWARECSPQEKGDLLTYLTNYK
ncbi:MAG: DUF1924 domain-containing protein [Gammaproteobacteria bacterium]|nr:DUF1924 domain-containing protein [Gammaproteobacteria bacterium]